MLPLIIAPNALLRAIAKPVVLPPTDELVKLARDMFAAMEHYRGIGLAAPQVGHSLRLIVIATPGQPTAYVNPEIVKRSFRKVAMEEGCLSLPGVFGQVRRPEHIEVRYYDLAGTKHEESLASMVARIYQHEVDHLDGVLFTDRTKKITQGKELLTSYGLA